ncbi:hypothetical protein IT568_11525 [bacterium]|nr:hypothetical protein [bacterium]
MTTVNFKIFLLVFLGLPFCVFAQHGRKVEIELHKTDEVIKKVSEEITPEDVFAVKFLEVAKSVQAEAYEKFDRKNLRKAVKLTLEARRKAFEAGKELKDSFVPLQNLNKLKDFIFRSERIIKESHNEEALKIFDDALEKFRSAKIAYEEENYQTAKSLVKIAFDLTHTALKLAKGNEKISLEQEALNELKRNDVILEKAKNSNLDISEAINIQKDAWQKFNESKFGMALRLTNSAKKLLKSIFDDNFSKENLSPSKIENTIIETEKYLSKIQKMSGKDEMLTKAEEHLVKAKKLKQTGNLRLSLLEIKIANNLISEVEAKIKE